MTTTVYLKRTVHATMIKKSVMHGKSSKFMNIKTLLKHAERMTFKCKRQTEQLNRDAVAVRK